MGRPSKYIKDADRQAKCLTELGAIDADLAKFFGVSIQTITTWKKKHSSFLASLKKGKADADSEVKKALFKRATGYSHPDTHISNYMGEITVTAIEKHYPPDTTACIFWLQNRDPENWKPRKASDGPGDDGVPPTPQKVVIEVKDARKK